MELKPLPQSLRKRRRYIVIDIVSDEKKSLGEIVEAIWNSVMDFLGEVETAKAGVWVVKDLFDEESQKCAVKVNHSYVEKTRAALALIDEVDNDRTSLHVIGVTGTMKSARAKYFD